MPKFQRKESRRRRRANGEGCITQLKDGRWRVLLTVSFFGKKRRVSRVVNTQAEAVAKRDELKQQAQTNLLNAPARMTLGEYIDLWLTGTVKQNTVPNTHRVYRTLADLHIKPILGLIPLRLFEPVHVEQFLAQLTVSAAKKFRLYRLLSSVLKRAVRTGLLPTNPCGMVDSPRYKPRKMQPLSHTEARRLIAVCGASDYGPLVRLAIETGMRIGEMLGLHWEAVHMEDKYLVVDQQIQDMPSGTRVTDLKTGSSKRRIEISEGLAAELLKHRQSLVARGLAACKLVFPAPRGGFTRQATFYMKRWKPMLAAAEVSHRGIHNLRHTAASFMLGEGVPVHEVAAILGHANPAITLKVYAHFIETRRGSAAEAMSKLLNEPDCALPVRQAARRPKKTG